MLGEPGLEPSQEEQLLGKHSLLQWGCGGAGLEWFVCARAGVSRMWPLVTLSCVAGAVNRGFGVSSCLSKHHTNAAHMGKQQQQRLRAASVLKNQIKENAECLGKQEIYSPLLLCLSTAPWPGLSHQSRTSMEIRVWKKGLLRVFLTAIFVGEECLATLNFTWISALLCVNASLVLAPGRGNVRDDLQLGGCREGHWSPLGKRMCRGNTSVELVVFFFLSSLPGFTFVCAFQTEGKQNLHGCGKLGES